MILQRLPPEPHARRRTPLRSYRIMGNHVVSDFALRDLPASVGARTTTSVLATTRAFPPAGDLVREIRDDGGDAIVRLTESAAGLQYRARDVGTFWIEPCGRHIWYRIDPDALLSDVEHMLAGPVLGLGFQAQGQTLLHAGAVAVDGVAVGFMASHGFGKSTLTASFVQAGHAMITDDVLPLNEHDGQWSAHQSVPRMKLWGDSLAAFGEDEQRYDRVISRMEKRRVPVDGRWGRATANALPLAALYLLQPHADPARPVEVAAIDPVQSVLAVLGNTYMADALRGERALRALAAATRIASVVPVRSVSYHRAFDTLPDLRAALCADVREQQQRHDRD